MKYIICYNDGYSINRLITGGDTMSTVKAKCKSANIKNCTIYEVKLVGKLTTKTITEWKLESIVPAS